MAKKKEEQAVVQNTEEMKLKFQEKLIEILALGKKKKNILEYQEISDFFKELQLDAEKMELVLDYLENNGNPTFPLLWDSLPKGRLILDGV